MSPRRDGAPLAAVLIVALLCVAAPPPAAAASWSGLPLAEALDELRQRGLEIFFTTAVVTPEMIVAAEPRHSEPRAILAELLAPHRLEARRGPGGALVVVRRAGAEAGAPTGSIVGAVRLRDSRRPIDAVAIRVVGSPIETTSEADGSFELAGLPAGPLTLEVSRRGFVVERLDLEVDEARPRELTVELDPTPVMEEELVVVPSRLSMWHREPAAPLALSRDDLAALPHLSDDFFRALSLLPGVAANDVSAQFHPRGARRDETRILLDGQELYGSFHLQDFDNALSVVSSSTLETVDLSTGGFPVEHGDRMSGVLDMTTRTPAGPLRAQVGASLLNTWVGGAGAFARQRGSWIGQARRGTSEFSGRLLGDEQPHYWDLFGKLQYQLDPAHSLRVNLLRADDRLRVATESDGDFKRVDTDYGNRTLWVTHLALVNPRLFVETAAAGSQIDRSRNGLEIESDVRFAIRDVRRLEVLELRQQWQVDLVERHSLRAGFEGRLFDTRYDYESERAYETPIADIRDDPRESTLFRRRFEEESESLFAADRIRLSSEVTVEIGARYDRHTQTDESLVSPRFNLAWTPRADTVVRLAWGRFTQSQRPYELQVEDGETRFRPVERAEHQILGVEHFFGDRGALAGLVARLELYRRRVGNPLVRYENLYEPLNTFPEVEPDRVRVAPDTSLAQGVELFLRGRLGRRVGWWANYAYATTEDRIGGEEFPRRFDQTHAVNLDFDYRPTPRWSLNLAWRYHTGWPTTPLELVERVDEEGELDVVPVLGRRFSDRLSDYHRLDLRASRLWQWPSTRLRLFLDVQNVYDRANLAGFDYEVDEDAGVLIENREFGVGFLPSIGVEIDF